MIMLCSNCRNFSIHLPNYDSFICENGHCFCQMCFDDKNQQCCIMCRGQITQEAQFHLEGVPTAVFKKRKKKDSTSAVESENPGSFTDVWFSQNPKQFDSEVPFASEELHWDSNNSGAPVGDSAFMNFSNGRIYSVGDSNATSKCKNANINIKPSKFSCKLSHAAECCMSCPNPQQRDPKDMNKRFLKSEIDFVQNEDYHKRLAQAKEIEELFRRPGVIKSSKIDLNNGSTMEPDTTFKENLKDFREVNNYVNPPYIDVFALTSMPDPLILAKFRSQNINNNKNQQQSKLKKINENVDVCTMMDLCLEPCLNYVSFTAKDEEEVNSHVESSQDNQRYVEAKYCLQRRKSLRSIIRDPFHSEEYSNFDKHRSQQSNNLITKTNFSWISRDSSKKYNRSTQEEISNLGRPINIPEELIQQSEKAIREKIKVYSNLKKETGASKLVQSKFEFSLNMPKLRSNIREEEADFKPNQSRSIGISTESYPKLNPDLALLSPHFSLDSQIYEKKLHPVPICKRISHLELEKVVSGEKKQQQISEYSKFSEGPFIQSISEVESEELTGNMKSTSQFLQESVIITENNETENNETENNKIENNETENNEAEKEVECVKYDKVITTDLESKKLPKNDEFQNALNKLQKLKENTSNTIKLKDFIEMFPDMSCKEIKNMILSLPDEYDEINIEEALLFKLQSIISSNNPPEQENPPEQKNSGAPEIRSSNISMKAAAGWRAYYTPMSNKDPRAEPVPQYKPITFEVIDKDGSVVDTSLNEIPRACDLNIPRSPANCPITDCKKVIFYSDLSRHIKLDHSKIPIETLSPGKCKNLFLDPRVAHRGINKCHYLYLVMDKIRDFGSREFKNVLPVLVMSTKVNVAHLASTEYPGHRKNRGSRRQRYLLIWLTGLSPKDMDIRFSVTAWSRSGPSTNCHTVNSGILHSFKDKQDPKTLYKSGQALVLSEKQCAILTRGGKKMIELQVVVH